MDILSVMLSALFSVAAIFIITKLMGHKQVAQLDFFDYVSGITIGSIAAEMATEIEKPWKPLVALAVYGAASLFLNRIAQKYMKTRKYINGAPSILFSEGKLFRENLKKAKLDLSEFMLLCREAGYFDLGEIEVAVFETNGRLSILPKSEHRPATPGDFKLSVKGAEIGTELILDGQVMGENLSRLKKDEKWLLSELKKQGYSAASEIFLAVFRKKDARLSIYPMN